MPFDKNEAQNGRRYYWLKLKDDFFGELTTIAMRKQRGGDAVCIAYMKLMLSALKTGGEIRYEGVLGTLESELAMLHGESEETMRKCVESMLKFGLAERTDDGIRLTALDEMVGSESYSAKRMRDYRRSNADQPEPESSDCEEPEFSETEISASEEQLPEVPENGDKFSESEQTVGIVHDACENVHTCDIEKRNKKREKRDKKTECVSDRARPTLAAVSDYCAERGGKIDPERWFNYYTANGFMVGKAKMKDWKACVRAWESNGFTGKSQIPVDPNANAPSIVYSPDDYQNISW